MGCTEQTNWSWTHTDVEVALKGHFAMHFTITNFTSYFQDNDLRIITVTNVIFSWFPLYDVDPRESEVTNGKNTGI